MPYKDKIKEKEHCKKYYLENKEKMNRQSKEYRLKNKEKMSEWKKEHYLINKEKIKLKSKNWYKNNKDKVKEYEIKNKEKIHSRMSKWRQDNIRERRKYEQEYKATKMKQDPVWALTYKIKHRLRNRILKIIKRNQRYGSAVSDLGCSIDQLKQYLESKFKPGMTWSNWTKDGWHIDHIKSLSSFDLTNREQFLEACNYTNLQPLWCKENLSKGAN